MNPNQALQEILELRLAVIGARSNEEAANAGGELAYRLGDLDEWIKGGGFLPRAWWAGSHQIRLTPAPKFGYRTAVAAVCSCGYNSGSNSPSGAARAGADHLAAKWQGPGGSEHVCVPDCRPNAHVAFVGRHEVDERRPQP